MSSLTFASCPATKYKSPSWETPNKPDMPRVKPVKTAIHNYLLSQRPFFLGVELCQREVSQALLLQSAILHAARLAL